MNWKLPLSETVGHPPIVDWRGSNNSNDTASGPKAYVLQGIVERASSTGLLSWEL